MPRSTATPAAWRSPLNAVAARLGAGRARAERTRAAEREAAYPAWVEEVEPGLAAVPRVHRFATPPVLGDASTPAVPLAVCIVAGGTSNAARQSLDAQSVAPAAVVEGAFERAAGELRSSHVVVVGAGDRLAPRALERLGQALTLAPDAVLVTCDHDRLDGRGGRHDPRCCPGPSPDALAAGVQLPAPVLVGREAALVAQARPGGGRDQDLLVELSGRDGARHAHVPAILLHRRGPESWDGQRRRRRMAPAVDGEPTVEVIVLFRDRPKLLERCLRSLLKRTAYERLSVLAVDNGSTDGEVEALLARLAADPRVRVRHDPSPFNFAALNSRALTASTADFVVFLNNDTEVRDPGWVEALLAEAQREEVGAVAPLLTYSDGSVQHAGAALGLHGYAGHPFAGLQRGERTAFGAAADGTRNWLAVTAACMMVARRKLDAVGGLDESFVVAGNDVDLCLRLTKAGHRSLCLPHVSLIHDESASRDPLALPPGDFERSAQAYGAFRTVGDPFYNPALTLTATDCALGGADEARPA